MSHMMLSSARATRGKRMSSLVGQAAEDDEAFWGADIWEEEGSDADSYEEEEEEVKPDQFDSDFNDTETEEESGSDEEKAVNKQGKKQERKPNKFKEAAKPAAKKVRLEVDVDDATTMEVDSQRAPASSSRKKRREISAEVADLTPRTLRQSTKSKTATADEVREEKEKQEKLRSKVYSRPEKPTFNQKELLREALGTEEENFRWVQSRKFLMSLHEEEEKKTNNNKTKFQDYKRFHSSKKGTFITFSNVDAVPEMLTDAFNVQPDRPNNVCAITGLPAKYRDPHTDLPYANLAAYKELRKRYPK